MVGFAIKYAVEERLILSTMALVDLVSMFPHAGGTQPVRPLSQSDDAPSQSLPTQDDHSCPAHVSSEPVSSCDIFTNALIHNRMTDALLFANRGIQVRGADER